MTHHILTADFLHESNTFKRGLTGLNEFRAGTFALGAEAIDLLGAANTELAGFLAVAAAQGWRHTHVVSAHAEPGGPVSRAAFDHVAGLICDAARVPDVPLSGILLSLHGAMVTEDHEDGEGELLSRLRAIVGPDLPITITLEASTRSLVCR